MTGVFLNNLNTWSGVNSIEKIAFEMFRLEKFETGILHSHYSIK
jgi:hypothetical protein